MRLLSLAAAGAIVAGCATKDVETVDMTPPAPELTRADCYTVVLFDDPPVIAPDESVPPENSAYLGSWTNGAWNGQWCTELYVTQVNPDRSVELYEMHAPYEEWGQPASAYRRTARIDEQGNLRFRYGTESVSYAMVDGTLHASRSGRFGNLKAVLVNPAIARLDAAVPTTAGLADAPVKVADASKQATARP